MLTSRVILSNLLRARCHSYSKLVHPNSFFSSPSFSRENEYQISSVSRLSCRALCTNASSDFSEIPINRTMGTKFNLTKQIMIRGKAATLRQEELINSFIFPRETATLEEWQELVKEVFSLEFGTINDINIDSKIVDSCVASLKLDMARSYLSYMKSQKKKFNGAVVSAYIKVCFLCKDFMTEQDKARMKLFTEFLQKRYAVADSSVCESVVKGLILQRKVDEALDTIAKNQDRCKINRSTRSAAAIGLLENGRVDEAVNFIQDNLKKEVIFTEEIYLKCIEVLKDSKNNLERLLKILRLYDIKPTKIVCDHLLNAFQSLSKDDRLIGSYGTIKHSGECSVCHGTLNPVELTEKEFEELRLTFLNNVLVAGDIFKNTTPQELQKFLRMVESEAPFDVVLDGLNVAYMVGTKVPNAGHVNVIQHVVSHFRERGLKVFLIGREHMRKWPNFSKVLGKLECRHFLINDLSEDDPFMVYATMYSGIHTDFVTRDLLRTQKFNLQSDKFAALFKRWQQAHQIHITFVNPQGRVYLRNPLNFQMGVQCNEAGVWHLPYLIENESGNEYGIHHNWLCLNRIQ